MFPIIAPIIGGIVAAFSVPETAINGWKKRPS